MVHYKDKIIALFGEEHLESDEKFLETERQLKQRLKNTFGSDSEEDNPSLTDSIELSCSDIEEEEEEEEEEPTNMTNNRITVQTQADVCLVRKKALAQYQRQVAACVTRQQNKKPIHLPPHIVVQLKDEDVSSLKKTLSKLKRIFFGQRNG